jgi:RNA-binding protein
MRGDGRKLGVVENIAHDGSLLVRSAFAPSSGVEVLDRRRRQIGRVVRVFGPTKEPIVSVRPVRAAPLSLIGSDVFVSEEHHAS